MRSTQRTWGSRNSRAPIPCRSSAKLTAGSRAVGTTSLTVSPRYVFRLMLKQPSLVSVNGFAVCGCSSPLSIYSTSLPSEMSKLSLVFFAQGLCSVSCQFVGYVADPMKTISKIEQVKFVFAVFYSRATSLCTF